MNMSYKIEPWYRLEITDGNAVLWSDCPRYPSRPLKVRIESNGYPRVALTIGGRVVHKTLHSLVAEAVYGPRPEGHHINHIDNDRTNYRPENLEYVTPQENVQHCIDTGRFHWMSEVYMKGEKHWNYKDGRAPDRREYQRQYKLRQKLKREVNK